MAELTDLSSAVAELVHDGDSLAMEGFTHLIPFAAGGISASAISKPPIQVEQVSVRVPTGLKKPAFRTVPAWYVSQGYSIETTAIDTLMIRRFEKRAT